MPRYFFNVHDGKDLYDKEGTELAGIGEARDQAIRTAGEIISKTAIPSGTAARGR